MSPSSLKILFMSLRYSGNRTHHTRHATPRPAMGSARMKLPRAGTVAQSKQTPRAQRQGFTSSLRLTTKCPTLSSDGTRIRSRLLLEVLIAFRNKMATTMPASCNAVLIAVSNLESTTRSLNTSTDNTRAKNDTSHHRGFHDPAHRLTVGMRAG